MDRRERFNSLTLLFQAALQGWQSNIWTALPGTYQGPGEKIGTANVQPTVQVQTINSETDQWGPNQNLPMCLDCPISWPGGKRGRLVWPLEEGDEGLLVFSSRCIDNWWLSGGIQAQAEYRMHDLSDGTFIPGIFSQPNVPGFSFPAPNMRLTSDDGLTYVELDDVGKIVSVVAPGGITLDGPVSFPDGLTVGGVALAGAAGILSVTGGVAASTTLTAIGEITRGLGGGDQVDLGGHTHTYTKATSGPNTPDQTLAPTAGT